MSSKATASSNSKVLTGIHQRDPPLADLGDKPAARGNFVLVIEDIPANFEVRLPRNINIVLVPHKIDQIFLDRGERSTGAAGTLNVHGAPERDNFGLNLAKGVSTRGFEHESVQEGDCAAVYFEVLAAERVFDPVIGSDEEKRVSKYGDRCGANIREPVSPEAESRDRKGRTSSHHPG